MNLAKFSFNNRTTTVVVTCALFVAGLLAFMNMGRLEDPEFTIKEALVITAYPGASPEEVEEEVTDHLEKAVQKLGKVRELESRSVRGLSTLTVKVEKTYGGAELDQTWDQLRRKVTDAQSELPPGAMPSLVVDDYGDVYGIFLAIYGEDYSYAELYEHAKLLERELLLVKGVAKIDLFGVQDEVVYVEPNRARMAELGISDNVIVRELRHKNLVVAAGKVAVGADYLAFEPTGLVEDLAAFEKILLTTGETAGQIYLGDIATIRRGYADPSTSMLRYDAHAAIGLGISARSGGNVVDMGTAIERRLKQLETDTPVGIEYGQIAYQSTAVVAAIDAFIISLAQAVGIVVVVLLLFMGLRSGIIIAVVLLLTIVASFPFLPPLGVSLERVSLGALVIALGMLVDNAIVVVDGVLVRLKRGLDGKKAAIEVVGQTSLPLLGATLVAVLAFASIGTSADSTGEFTRSLFYVILVSLIMSWLIAVTVTPLIAVKFLKATPAKEDGPAKDPYDTAFFRGYRAFLRLCLKWRYVTLLLVVVMFAGALYGFGGVKRDFFPKATRAQFMVHYWQPEGTYIGDTNEKSKAVEEFIRKQKGVTHVTTSVGQGPLRFMLTMTPEKVNSAYTLFLVDTEDFRLNDPLIAQLETALLAQDPDVDVWGEKFALGPSSAPMEARFFGPDRNIVRRLASEAKTMVEAEGDCAKGVRFDTRERVKVIEPILDEQKANANGITRPMIADVLLSGFEGSTVGIYRERDELLPIVVRAEEEERADVASTSDLQIWSPTAQQRIPLAQVVSGYKTAWEDSIIMRFDRRPTVSVKAQDNRCNTAEMMANFQPRIEKMDFPDGYGVNWGGTYKDQNEAMEFLAKGIPIFFGLMILIVLALFNSVGKTAVIWLCVPLSIIGVTVGLRLTGNAFDFMAILGFMSLAGMLIKNAIVLIDEIGALKEQGNSDYEAVIGSATSRLTPVSMAASTTALGMIPLLLDPFFGGMAVTISVGLVFATILTMIVVPTLYATIYRVEVGS